MKPFYPLIFLLFVGCLSTNHNVRPPKFSYNNHYYNSLIVDRYPEYGFTSKDGCIVESQIFLSLKSISPKGILGVVQDVKTKEFVSGANISIYFQGQDGPTRLSSDAQGEFQFSKQSDVLKIEVLVVGYRGLVVDFSNGPIL